MARVTNFPIPKFINGNMNAQVISDAIPFYGITTGWSAQIMMTGSPIGTLKIQISLDPDFEAPANWSDLSTSLNAVSGAGDVLYNISTSFYNWLRFVYTPTSGSGTINGRINLKAL